MSTRTLPTDKHGNLYYGEKSHAEACQSARNLQDDYFAGQIDEHQMKAGWRGIESRLRGAGYTGAADKFKKEWLS